MADSEYIRTEINIAKEEGMFALIDKARLIAKGEEPYSTGDLRRDSMLINLIFWLFDKRDNKSLRKYRLSPSIKINIDRDDNGW